MSSSEKRSNSLPIVDDFDTSEDRKLLRKVDLRYVLKLKEYIANPQSSLPLQSLLPIFTLLYLLSFLDRTNIGNAKLDGLVTDLKISGPSYNTSLALFFVSYVIFEVPANYVQIILKRFNPQFWLPSLTLVWGIVSICQGLVTNQAGLFGIRILLGATVYLTARRLRTFLAVTPFIRIDLPSIIAGLFPGVIFVFSMYYCRRERSWRVAIFFGGAALAGAFGGILAYSIGKMDGIGGRRGWQWIFILEGVLTVAISLGAYFVVPTWPHKAKFLTESERERLLARLQADSDAGKQEQFKWFFVRQAFTDHLVWAYALLFHGFAFVLYSLSLFLPTIIAGLGFATWKAQLMTVPPNTLAALSIWTTVWLSANSKIRAPFIISSAVVAIIGYIILIATKTPGTQYFGVHLAAAGIYTGNALLLSENVSGQTKRAVAVAMQITIGDVGAIAGVLIYRPNFASHHYRKPHIIAIGYLLFAITAASYLWVQMHRENKRRNRWLDEGNEEAVVLDAEDKFAGDRDVRYRYQL
ncbi:hypothetical protein PILCRDRAFT_12219 [Piloderma croceum F 1598]|uniref:Major facilitator superfamily (MFS) profile domain-containing protein n=1 Tax=Piloderma croceum (strain F 1598) TaxID=765440 RepID=A0A0C3ATI1_PILCF|nr:hypothetical protein PILCRDRAFT_12219 [Piloderma croceum F 1598]